MAKRKGLRTSTITFWVSFLVLLLGVLLWLMQDPSTKLFSLSNDLIGAGLIVSIVSGVIMLKGK